MAKFNYLARTPQGKIQSGTIEATNKTIALQVLQEHHLIVVQLKSAERISLFFKEMHLFQRVKRKEIFVFFRQLAVLVGADVPVVQSLQSLGQQTKSRYFQEIIMEMSEDIESGLAFSKALAKHPHIFSPFCINLIKAGEVAGRLQESLNYLADYLEREYYLVSKIRGAMVYPAFIFSALVVVGILVMTLVMPQLTSVLEETGQELPLPTQIVIAVSKFINQWFWLMFLAVVALTIGLWRYLKTDKGKEFWDQLELSLPIFGSIFQKTYLSRFADNLSALVKGGVPIIHSLAITAEVINNDVFKRIINQARQEVRVGKTISSVLEKHKEFPALFSQMIKTGEQTGKIDSILEKLALFYNKEVDNIVNNLSQLIEPVLLVVLGLAVGILVTAVFMPIYNMVGAF